MTLPEDGFAPTGDPCGLPYESCCPDELDEEPVPIGAPCGIPYESCAPDDEPDDDCPPIGAPCGIPYESWDADDEPGKETVPEDPMVGDGAEPCAPYTPMADELCCP